MDVNRLSTDDIKYELRIRGVSDIEDEEQMKKILKKFLGLEQETGATMIKEKVNVEEEEQYCRSKVTELRMTIPEFSGRYNDGRYKKILASITHLLIRLERLPKESQQKAPLVQELNDLKFSLDIKAQRPPKEGQNPEEPTEENGSPKSRTMSASSASSAAPNEKHCHENPQKHRAYLPVSQWKLSKFTGDNPRISLGQFLLNIEDKCISRHVDKEELYDSAADLFDGTALAYFRYIRKRVNSWPELVAKLREVFQGPYFDERLMEEIKDRKQGPNEPIAIYLAKMDNYFQRLAEPPNEKERLKIIERNLHPFFLKHLSHVDYKSLIELEEIGKKLERGKKLADGFHKFSTDKKLEPDLSYRNPAGRFKRGDAANKDANATCWYCHRPGHRYQDCDQHDSDS